MFLNRRTLKTFATLARQTLGIKPRDSGPVVSFREVGDSFQITANYQDCWIQYREIGEFDFTICALPWKGLQRLTEAKSDDLTLTMEREENRVEWEENGVTHAEAYPDGPADEVPIFPTVDGWKPQDARLLTALQEANQTVAKDSTRYALNCLLLRGKSNDLVATDSRQLLIQKGFDWPWTDERMMPASRGFRSATLRRATEMGPVEVGRSEKHVVFRFGNWSLAFPIVTDARFPSVDTIVPSDTHAQTTLCLDDADHKWLGQRLPRSSAPSKQVATIELNGAVAVRCAERDKAPVEEWILSNSRRQGPEACVETDACYLSRLHDLGLSRIEVGDENSPFVARDSQQTYLWMGLSGKPTPRPKTIEKIVSPRRRQTRRSPQPPKLKEPTMPQNSTSPPKPEETSEIDQLIEHSTRIKTKLKDLQMEMQELITTLRGQKKQAKIVRNTIDSLQKLNTLQA